MIFLVPSALSIYGGETWIYHFEYCDDLRVDITASQTIDEGEYNILNECEGENNSFVCKCSNDFDFNVSFEINTVNDYVFDFNYDYTKDVVETTTSSGGGGGGGAFSKDLRVGTPFKAVLIKGLNSYFKVGGERHTMRLTKLTDDFIELEIKSEPTIVGLFLNETKVIEFEEGYLQIYFKKIYRTTVTLMLTRLEKEEVIEPMIEDVTDIANETAIVEELPEEIEEPTEYVGVLEDEPKEKGYKGFIIVIAILVVILGLVAYFYFKDKK